MAEFLKNEFVVKHRFDNVKCRHYLNEMVVVLHCHHYATLYTQLAMDCAFLDAKKLLAESMEDTFYPIFEDYFDYGEVDDIEDRVTIVEDCYSGIMGMGKLKISCLGELSGEVILEYSHLDEGWLKKWGKYDKPVNYMTAGYIAAAFAAILEKPMRSFKVVEIKSIAMGDPISKFKVVAL